MSITITASYRTWMESTKPNSILSKFTFNNSNLSNRVIQFPTIIREAGDITGETVVFDIENASQLFNSLNTNREQLLKTGIFEYGYTSGNGSEDLIQMFGGELTRVELNEGRGKMIFENKLTKLKRRRIGSETVPIDYTNSLHNPADLAWYICTSHGGLSGVQSTSNSDIDYTTWNAWKTALSDDVIGVNAYFEGNDLIETLELLQRLTDSVIWSQGDNKIYFSRWTGTSSYNITITDSYIVGKIDYKLNTDSILNKVTVQLSYNTQQNTWAGQIVYQNSDSVGSYGIFEAIYDDTLIWYCTSATAMNLAQRLCYRRGNANAGITFDTPLRFLDISFGDYIDFTTQVYSLSGKKLNLKKYSIDTDAKIMTIVADEGFDRGAGRLSGFIIDDTYYGLLDQTYNPLF